MITIYQMDCQISQQLQICIITHDVISCLVSYYTILTQCHYTISIPLIHSIYIKGPFTAFLLQMLLKNVVTISKLPFTNRMGEIGMLNKLTLDLISNHGVLQRPYSSYVQIYHRNMWIFFMSSIMQEVCSPPLSCKCSNNHKILWQI